MALKLRREIPAELANAPRLRPWLQVFHRAFWDLIADRRDHDSTITWSTRQHWAEVHGLDYEATELLHRFVAAMDVAFLGHLRQTRTKQEPGVGDSRGDPRAVRD